MMNLEDKKNEDIDMREEYEMIPLESMMYGYDQMNMNPIMGMNPSAGMDPSMGMPMGYMQDANLDMGMNPWMRMNQFNEGMFMNSFNPMGMMYGNASMNDYDDEGSRQEGNYGEEETFKDEYNKPNRINPNYNDTDSIVRKIERYNPAIFRVLTR